MTRIVERSSRIVVQQSDVDAHAVVLLIPMGNLLTEPTLDLCNGTFPSEHLRTARFQVAVVNRAPAPHVAEHGGRAVPQPGGIGTGLRGAAQGRAASCPHTPVVSPVGEETAETIFKARPTRRGRNATVNRQAYSFVTTTTAPRAAGEHHAAVAVYLRRGRAPMGLYFAQPNAPHTGGGAAHDRRHRRCFRAAPGPVARVRRERPLTLRQ